MRKLVLSTILLLLPFTHFANQIPIGYHSKYAKIWRFYERNEQGGYDPKVLVYNLSGQQITVCVKVVLHGNPMDARAMGYLKEFTGLGSDTVLRPVVIAAYGYGVYTTDQLLNEKSTGFYDAVIINGEGAGIMPIRPPLKLQNARFRFYSYDAVSGGTGALIGTDSLMVKEGETGRMHLFYSNVQAQRRNNWNVNEWKFDFGLYSGDATISIKGPTGKEISISNSDKKLSMIVDITQLDTFSLDAIYKILSKDSLSQIDYTRHSGNGSSNSAILPIFLKRN